MQNATFEAEIALKIARGVSVASALVIFAFFSFAFVDPFFHKANPQEFIFFRVIVITIALAVLMLSVSPLRALPWVMRLLGFLIVTDAGYGVSRLTLMTGGVQSPYWTMLMLTFFGGSMVLRFSALEAFFIYALQVVIYAFVMLNGGESSTHPAFLTSVGGITVALAVTVTGNWYIRKLERVDFELRKSLAVANERLQRSVGELEYQNQQTELKHLQDKLWLAHDLHDTVGAQLSQICVIVENDREIPRVHLGVLAHAALENVRNFAHILKGEEKIYSLRAQLLKVKQSFVALGRYEISFDEPLEEITIEAFSLLHIERILAEWTANIIRHSHARRIAFGVRERREVILLWFFQDRPAFTWRGVAERGGLKGIAERARQIGAQAQIRSHREGALFLLRIKNKQGDNG